MSSRLSRMSAWASFASPCTTLMRSKTTRRSAPIIKIQVAQTNVKIHDNDILPIREQGRPPSAAVEVVFPTPSFPGGNNYDRSHMEPLRCEAMRTTNLVNDGLMPLVTQDRQKSQLRGGGGVAGRRAAKDQIARALWISV